MLEIRVFEISWYFFDREWTNEGSNAIAYFQIERGWVWVGLLWDKQHETQIVRKSVLKLATFSSLVFIGPILNEVQPFKNYASYKFSSL